MHPRLIVVALLALLALLAGGCGEQPSGPAADVGLPPAETEARALHCYLVLTLTIDQLADFEGAGTREARRQSEELHRARRRHAAALEELLLDELRANPLPSLRVLLDEFDADGDGELSSVAELNEFNRHVAACL
jgi:hypothetical protein